MTQVIPLQRIQYWSVGQNQFYETEALYPMSSKTHYLGICRQNKGMLNMIYKKKLPSCRKSEVLYIWMRKIRGRLPHDS